MITKKEYKNQFELQNFIWKCNQSIKDNDEETIVFTNKSTYKQVGSSGNDVIILIDDKGNIRGVHKFWFTSI